MATERTFYAVYAPVRASGALTSTPLGRRYWFRWQVVRETYYGPNADGISAWGYEHHSTHWTESSAFHAALMAQRAAVGRD